MPPVTTEIALYVVGSLVVGACLLLVYLLKRWFTGLEEGTREVSAKVGAVQTTLANQNTVLAVLGHRVDQLEHTLPWAQEHRRRGGT